jgi:hypothetical protein
MSSIQHKDLTEQEEIFLDKVALEVCKVLIRQKPPEKDSEVKQVSRISYRTAAIMLQTKKHFLPEFIDKL